ncbi:protein LKAAEAR1 isoform X2 [Cavia porcellus]|uniref:protein LKAAEAR1 isoform X2 n=1 Tax=Cavia porcellus TaxID=10141 RepID=UPI002FE0EC39
MWPPAAKGAHGAEPDGQRAGPAAEAPRPGWALTLDGLAALPLTQRRHHLLFSDLPEDGAAAASVFPRQSAELENRMPDPCAWTRPPDQPAGPAEPLLGVLKAAEARARVRSLRLRYIRMRAEEITLLIRQQGSARAAIRLELLLPPQLKSTRIPDPLDRQERRRVETILEEARDGSIFPR